MRKEQVGYQLCMLLYAMIIFCSCSSQEEERQKAPIKVKVVQVSESSTMEYLSYVGVVEENESTALSFAVSGKIQTMNVIEGKRVAKGTTLATLDNTTAGSTLEAAQAALSQAQDAYKRLKQLHDNGSLPDIKMVEIETKLQQAQSAYNMALKNHDDFLLKAPFHGVIGKKSLSVGENALPGQVVCSLLNIDEVKVKIAVPEKEVSAISDWKDATIQVPALGDQSFQGTKIERGVQANPFTHTYDMYVVIPNPSHALLPGMVCSVRLGNQEEAATVMIPVRAVHAKGDDSHFVWTVKGETASRVAVEIGEVVGNNIVIRKGLQQGEQIIVDGYQKVGEGTKIVY